MLKEKKPTEKERSFSIDLRSKIDLKNITLNDNFQDNALIEGTIGKLEHAGFVDNMILEVLGTKGVLRIDISENEIKKIATEANPPNNPSQREVN